MPNTRTGHINWANWSFDYSVSDSEGLSLLNGAWKGGRIIGKFSMPVIRVKYRRDGGWHDWRRVLGLGAGPYADQIRWVLGGSHGLQKISNRNNEYVGVTSYSSAGVRWLEISVYARIGAYHIAQQWHLSETGVILPRVWSKGLTINMDHIHHPYWRLDFDIDGTASNTVYFQENRGWFFYPREANDVKDSPRHKRWFVRNDITRKGAWIVPGPNDGQADGFSGIDMGVRLFHPSEEANPWPFGTGGLGFLNGEGVAQADIVFWYVAHLHHHASEGGDAWHWAGPTIAIQDRLDL